MITIEELNKTKKDAQINTLCLCDDYPKELKNDNSNM